MIKRQILKNKKGQVLGLPMYLIIVMIVAVAVIAAVIFMIPQGTKSMIAQVTDESVQTGDGVTGEVTFDAFTVQVKVTTNDERRDPIEGAIVRLVGGHAIQESDPTGPDGIASIQIEDAKLDSNINEAYMKMTVKAAGFEDFEDDQAVILYRG